MFGPRHPTKNGHHEPDSPQNPQPSFQKQRLARGISRKQPLHSPKIHKFPRHSPQNKGSMVPKRHVDRDIPLKWPGPKMPNCPRQSAHNKDSTVPKWHLAHPSKIGVQCSTRKFGPKKPTKMASTQPTNVRLPRPSPKIEVQCPEHGVWPEISPKNGPNEAPKCRMPKGFVQNRGSMFTKWCFARDIPPK